MRHEVAHTAHETVGLPESSLATGFFHFLWPLPCTDRDSRIRSTRSTLPPDRNRGGVSPLRPALPLLIFIMAASALADSGVVAVLEAGLSDWQPS